jgi:hypothetical protein
MISFNQDSVILKLMGWDISHREFVLVFLLCFISKVELLLPPGQAPGLHGTYRGECLGLP